MLVALVAAALWLVPALGSTQEVDIDPAACRTDCKRTTEQCTADALASTKECRDTANAPCQPWCPCTQFIGAAYFNCQLNCETCQTQVAAPLADCDEQGKEDAAECVQWGRKCERDCQP
jgi:hypothetical protein